MPAVKEEVRYEIKARGNFRTFVITPNRFEVVLSDGTVKGAGDLEAEQWNALSQAISDSNPNKWSTYEAPTNRRATDRAGTAQMHYTKGEVRYSSGFFDHGEPPADLKEVVELILKYSQKFD